MPEQFKVIRHVRTKLSCAKCERIVQVPAPTRPIERGMAGPGLLAHVLVSKYCDHQPLYRQSEIYARHGVELERSMLADWVGGCSRLLEPLVEWWSGSVGMSWVQVSCTPMTRRCRCWRQGMGEWEDQDGTPVDLRSR